MKRLIRRFWEFPSDQTQRIQGLKLEHLEHLELLAVELLEFEQIEDLMTWLDRPLSQ